MPLFYGYCWAVREMLLCLAWRAQAFALNTPAWQRSTLWSLWLGIVLCTLYHINPTGANSREWIALSVQDRLDQAPKWNHEIINPSASPLRYFGYSCTEAAGNR